MPGLSIRPLCRGDLDRLFEPRASHADHGAARLWAAHVETGFRSHGIGTMLVLHLEDVARMRGFGLVRLEVGKDDSRARQLYERLGYEVRGEETCRWTFAEGDCTIGVVQECWTMEKQIVSSAL